jgi:N-acetylglucosaminyl-diphospho-decaprenol L-rhamnosyltransferase
MPPSKTTVSTVTVTYWTGDILERCVDSLRQQAVDEIILIDNGNPVDVSERLDLLPRHDPRIRVIRPDKNTGFAAGCNLGASQANGHFIAMVNPDCVLAPDTISRMLKVAQRNATNWLCGGRLQNPDGSEQRGSRRETLTPWRATVELLRLDRIAPNHPYFRRFHQFEDAPLVGIAEVPMISGAFMFIQKRAYETLRGMDESFFIHFDDADLCMRVWKMGGRVLFCSNIPILHYRSSSDVSQTFVEWHKAKGLGYFFKKHFGDTYPGWFLTIVSTLVWFRFAAILPRWLASDLPASVRRFRRRRLRNNANTKDRR